MVHLGAAVLVLLTGCSPLQVHKSFSDPSTHTPLPDPPPEFNNLVTQLLISGQTGASIFCLFMCLTYLLEYNCFTMVC